MLRRDLARVSAQAWADKLQHQCWKFFKSNVGGDRNSMGAEGTGSSIHGGLTTKIHAVADANGLPIALKVPQGQAPDNPIALEMIDTLGAA